MDIENKQLTVDEVYQRILNVYQAVENDTMTAYKAQTLLSYLNKMVKIAEDWEWSNIGIEVEKNMQEFEELQKEKKGKKKIT